MKTTKIKILVQEVLATLEQPYSIDVIDEVFYAIENNIEWLNEYYSLCSIFGKDIVNQWGGYWIANKLDKVGKTQVSNKKSTLIGSYSILESDNTIRVKNPTEEEARKVVWDFYIRGKTDIPENIKNYKDTIVEMVQSGTPVSEAFAFAINALHLNKK